MTTRWVGRDDATDPARATEDECPRCQGAHKHSGVVALNFPRTVREDLREMSGIGARIAESVRWGA